MEMAGSSLSSAVEVTVPSNSLWYTVVGAAYLAIGEPEVSPSSSSVARDSSEFACGAAAACASPSNSAMPSTWLRSPTPSDGSVPVRHADPSEPDTRYTPGVNGPMRPAPSTDAAGSASDSDEASPRANASSFAESVDAHAAASMSSPVNPALAPASATASALSGSVETGMDAA